MNTHASHTALGTLLADGSEAADLALLKRVLENLSTPERLDDHPWTQCRLWYFHFALGERPDLAVIAEDLLGFAWYLETLRSTYPELALPRSIAPASTIQALNPDRPSCFVESAEKGVLNCP